MSRGRFITVEGGEGVGKSTNIAHLHERLSAAGVSVFLTREPGGTPLAEKIRHLLLQPDGDAPGETAELLLVFAARAQHLEQVIEPHLAAGTWVICDRFTDATFAYQGGGRGLSAEIIGRLEELVQGSVRPDFTLLLDAPVEVGLERARGRGELDRFERENLDFFHRVRACYLTRAAAEPRRFRIIDASNALEQVREEIDGIAHQLLAGRAS